nr:HEAT repeat domain-containing protein [Polyangium spumosum]
MELERRKLVEVGPLWIPLLRSARPIERAQVIRAAGARAFVPAVTAELVSILEKGERDAAVAAARALGIEGNEAAVEPLGRAVDHEPAELRFAALGSLRRVGSPRARDVLARVASSHPDPETKRVAATEQNLLAARPAAPPAAPPAGDDAGVRGMKGLLAAVVVVVLGAIAFFLYGKRKGKAE